MADSRPFLGLITSRYLTFCFILMGYLSGTNGQIAQQQISYSEFDGVENFQGAFLSESPPSVLYSFF